MKTSLRRIVAAAVAAFGIISTPSLAITTTFGQLEVDQNKFIKI